ncbi:hypothetical protein EDC96DRAFT_577714 [Choanephora cucurbitarum]|nr:hypothetical protein EDC96DRAFT_577714 [Choanephora cucurbitarum]
MVTIQKFKDRILQSKRTKIYIATACIQGIIIIALQSTIAYFNTLQLKKGLATSQLQAYQLSSAEDDSIHHAFERFSHIKWENFSFITFQLWFMCMSFDAIVSQNAVEIMALMSLNVALSVFSALEVIDGRRWLTTLNDIKDRHGIPLDTTPIQTAFYVEIALCAFVGAFGILFSHFSIAVTREIGWVIYKKIGADLSVQRMYRTTQFYVLVLKIDIFTEFLVSVFYLLQYALKSGFQTWITYVFVVITILMLPMLVFGRRVIANESKAQMALFIFFQGCVVFQLILIAIEASRSEDSWYIWFCFNDHPFGCSLSIQL